LYRWISGIVVGVVVLAVGAGCGSGGDSSTVTKAEFKKQAEAICAKRKKEWQSSLAAYEKEVTDRKAAGNIKVQTEIAEGLLAKNMLPALQEQLEALEELGAPEGSEEKAEAWLASLTKNVKEIEENGVESLVATTFQDFEKQSKDLGVSCPF